MHSLTTKPLRKPVHLLGITDEEIRWKLNVKHQSHEFFAKRYKRSETAGLLARFQERQPQGMTLVSDARGRIENLLFTIPPFYDQKQPDLVLDEQDERHFRTLLKHLSREKRRYTVLCHANQVPSVKSWFRELKIPLRQVQLAVSIFNYSIWAQDAYVALNDSEGNTTLCEGICFTRDHDMSVADDLALQTDLQSVNSDLYYQGGNILQAGDFALIGLDYLMENYGRMFLDTMDKVKHAFESLLGKPVIAVGADDIIAHRHRQYLGGGIFQPIFHLDMYITPTGVRNKEEQEIVFVGSPSLARKILGQPKVETDGDRYFDECARQLEEYFEVRRLPLLPAEFKQKDMEWHRFYYLSYNNALVENYIVNGKEKRKVYLPTYSQDVELFKTDSYLENYYGDRKMHEQLDKAAAGYWKKLGFKVFPMDGLEGLAMSWGSVHCMVKTLKRSPYHLQKRSNKKGA